VVGSNGVIINIDPATGSFQSQTGLGTGISLPPVVADSTLYIYDDKGQLVAFR
jgi:outer membrane protein assembly factor BamB